MSAHPEPNEVFLSLLKTAKHPVKKRNLNAIQEICLARHKAGSVSFKNVEIGRALEEAGVMVAKALNNHQSADYRTLIKAWQDFSAPAVASKARTSLDWMDRIEDPAIRSLVDGMRIEIADLRAKITHLQIHQKPITIYKQQAAKGEVSIIEPVSTLTGIERETLARSLDSKRLRERGIQIGPRGELIHQETGEILFERGFINALEKLLSPGPKGSTSTAN